MILKTYKKHRGEHPIKDKAIVERIKKGELAVIIASSPSTSMPKGFDKNFR